MLPGSLLWLTFILGLIFSFFAPQIVLYFMILFSLFWLFRVIYFIFYFLVAWKQYQTETKTDWLKEISTLPGHEKLYHLIFLPTAKESIDVLRTTFLGLKNSEYDKKKMMVVLAGEGRFEEHFKENAAAIEKEFGQDFYRLIVTVHPDNVPGEIKGKGANAHYAGHESQKIIDSLNIPYENIVVSYFDCDTVVHPRYFACLAAKYLKHPNPTHASFQPMVLYSNNIWDAPGVARVAAFSTTFWLMSELVRPDRLFTFSSHSMSFKALVDVNFWQNDIVTDDSRIFLQCFIHYNGDYEVVPIFVPVSMDAVMSDSYYKSLQNLYKQQRRWAWGVEHFPYLVWNFFVEKSEIPLRTRLRYVFNLTEGMYSWAAAPIFLSLLGRMPFWVSRHDFRQTILALNTPHVLQWIMTLAMAGILVSIVFSLKMLPPPPPNRKGTNRVWLMWQWILLPVTLLVFGSFPAVEAQTRLMLGKYLGFWVTDKARVDLKTKKVTALSYESTKSHG